MKTILYFDRHTIDEAEALETTATAQMGEAPVMMRIGIDTTVQEVEDLLGIDLRRQALPFLASAETDRVIDLEDHLDSTSDFSPSY